MGQPADLDIAALANKFNFSGGQIEDAISSARNLAMVKNPENPAISMDDLYRGCKAQSNKSLSAFAKNIPPKLSQNQFTLYNSGIFHHNWAIIDFNLTSLS